MAATSPSAANPAAARPAAAHGWLRHRPRSPLSAALTDCRHAFIGVGLFSAVLNMLQLTGPIFMLEVYDRVIPSRSIPTLVGISILAAVMFGFQGLLDIVRGRVLVRIAGSIDETLSQRVYAIAARLPLKALNTSAICRRIWNCSAAPWRRTSRASMPSRRQGR
jgi:ABC-type protease/lipase transport system fused ATPase/permease subunit